jgi:predicted hotdog family 3-hydroxylacyl-ACP dehydratase
MLKRAVPPVLDHAWIAGNIPHQGSMCLLDHVESWSEDKIRCRASSHLSADNPLRAHGQLGAACGIEYAAQAMAVHGALLAPQGSLAPQVGYLVSARGTTLYVARLDDVADELEIEAECMTRNDNNILYQFSISAAGRLLLSGRATVIVDANALGIAIKPQ